MAGFRKNWVSKAMLYLAFHFPFRQLKVSKLFGTVPETNVKAHESNLRLGFRDECLVEGVCIVVKWVVCILCQCWSLSVSGST